VSCNGKENTPFVCFYHSLSDVQGDVGCPVEDDVHDGFDGQLVANATEIVARDEIAEILAEQSWGPQVLRKAKPKATVQDRLCKAFAMAAVKLPSSAPECSADQSNHCKGYSVCPPVWLHGQDRPLFVKMNEYKGPSIRTMKGDFVMGNKVRAHGDFVEGNKQEHYQEALRGYACDCGWTHNSYGCGKNDGSYCWVQCCVGAW